MPCSVLSQLNTNSTANTDTFLRKIVLDSQSTGLSIPVNFELIFSE